MKDKIIKILIRFAIKRIELGGWSKRCVEDVANEILALFVDPVDYATIDPVKWEGVTISFEPAWGGWFPVITKDKTACPEELKEAYKAIREVREALLKLERSLGTGDEPI